MHQSVHSGVHEVVLSARMERKTEREREMVTRRKYVSGRSEHRLSCVRVVSVNDQVLFPDTICAFTTRLLALLADLFV